MVIKNQLLWIHVYRKVIFIPLRLKTSFNLIRYNISYLDWIKISKHWHLSESVFSLYSLYWTIIQKTSPHKPVLDATSKTLVLQCSLLTDSLCAVGSRPDTSFRRCCTGWSSRFFISGIKMSYTCLLQCFSWNTQHHSF